MGGATCNMKHRAMAGLSEHIADCIRVCVGGRQKKMFQTDSPVWHHWSWRLA